VTALLVLSIGLVTVLLKSSRCPYQDVTPASNNDDKDEDEDIDSGDSLRKAITLVKQVSFSLALIDTFSIPTHKLDS